MENKKQKCLKCKKILHFRGSEKRGMCIQCALKENEEARIAGQKLYDELTKDVEIRRRKSWQCKCNKHTKHS